jgi:hypothetical protein
MATVAQTGNSKGHKVFSLASANDETEVIPLNSGETVHIHATGMSGSTVQILEYVGSNATGVALSFDGATSFTSDFALNYTAGGKCGITVKLTVDGGTVVVTYTK